MKILVYGSNFSPELTGVGKYTGEMVAWFVERGHDVRVITAPPYYPHWRIWQGYRAGSYSREYCHGAVVYRAPVWVPRNPTGIRRIIHQLSFALTSLPIVLHHWSWRPHVIWMTEPPLVCAPAALALASLTRARAVLHIQDFEVDAAFALGILRTKLAKSIANRLEHWLMSRFDMVSTISRAMLTLVSQKGLAADRLLLVPNWSETLPVANAQDISLRRELDLPTDHVVAVYSGSMGAKQGLELLARVAKSLAHEKISFIFCGDGAGKAGLVSQCEGLTNVRFLPLQPQARFEVLLATADIQLLPQRSSAADLVMPSKLIGIMGSGKPVIATAQKGTELADVVLFAANCGLVVPPNNVAAFAQAIRELAMNPARRRMLGANGRSYVLTHLRKDKILSQLEEALQDLTSK